MNCENQTTTINKRGKRGYHLVFQFGEIIWSINIKLFTIIPLLPPFLNCHNLFASFAQFTNSIIFLFRIVGKHVYVCTLSFLSASDSSFCDMSLETDSVLLEPVIQLCALYQSSTFKNFGTNKKQVKRKTEKKNLHTIPSSWPPSPASFLDWASSFRLT